MSKIDKRFAAAKFQRALQEITSQLRYRTYALAGGLAVGHWVQNRKTQDLDFALVSQESRHLKKFFPHVLVDGTGIYSAKIYGVSVDFLKPAAYRWNREAIRNARDQFVESVKVPVVTPEYLILYKMHAERELDQEDVIALVRLPGVYERARDLVERYLSPQHAEELEQVAKSS